MAAQMTPRFRDLPDVDWASFVDGEVPTYGTATDTLTGETPAAGGGTPTGAAGGVLGGTYPDPAFAVDMATQAELDSHADDPSFVHGITNTADLATDAEVASAVSTHEADTSVHGIADTTALATDAEVAAAVSAHELDTTVHGVDTANVPTSGQKAALAGTSGTPGVANKFVTEDDPGLGGADLSDAVVLAPTADGRNVIESVGDAVPLTVGRTVPGGVVQQWLNLAGDPIAAVDADGGFAVTDPDGAALALTTAEGLNIGVLDATPTAEVLQTYVYSNPGWSFQMRVDGKMRWGNGTDDVDTELERTDVGELSLNGEPIVTDDDTRLADARTPTDSSVTAAKVNTALKPSGTAATTDESLRRLGTSASHAAAGDDTRFPTTGQKNALAGTAGTPGTGNEYATKQTTDTLLTSAAAAAAYQPVDSDLTAVAALTTTSYGRALLELANQAALQTAVGAQPLDSDLTAIAALTTTSYGRSLLEAADAAGAQTTLGVSTFIKTLLDDADASTARTTLGVTSGGDGGIRYPFYVTGKYYGAPGPVSASAGVLSQDRFQALPICIDVTTTFDRIGIHVTTLVASLTYRLGIYTYSSTGRPGTLVLDAGTVTGASTGVQLATISQQLTAGVYFLVLVPQGVAVGGAQLYHVNTGSTNNSRPIPQTGFQNDVTAYYAAGVSGALPGTAPTVTDFTGVFPNIMLRAA